MPIISIINQKGGCGKTTTAVNLSSALAQNRKKVLLIDMDPQGHASLALGIDPDGRSTVFDVLDMDMDKPLRAAIITLSENLHLAPSNIHLSALEQKLSGKSGREMRLRDKLATVRKKYDYIIIDCPPSLGLLTINALISSDRLIIPVDTSPFSLHGIEKLQETMAMLKSKLGHQPEMYGLATIFDKRTKFAKNFLCRMKTIFDKNLCHTVIPSTIKLREAADKGIPITSHSFFCAGSDAYLALAGEVLKRDHHKVVRLSGVARKVVRDTADVKNITFRFPDVNGARFVKLAGDFNDWDPDKHALKKAGNGVWVGKFPLKSGSYQYKYVVDGEWMLDPHNEHRVETDVGSVNSIITV